MLKLSRRTDYGLIALRHLAIHHGRGSASAREIAGRYRIPLPLLSKVLQRLARSGLLVADPGARGGYRLARDPHRISALEVIRAIDGPVLVTSCFDGACNHTEHCTVREPLRRVHQGILNLLAGITITDMAEAGAASGAREPHVRPRLYRLEAGGESRREELRCSE